MHAELYQRPAWAAHSQNALKVTNTHDAHCVLALPLLRLERAGSSVNAEFCILFAGILSIHLFSPHNGLNQYAPISKVGESYWSSLHHNQWLERG